MFNRWKNIEVICVTSGTYIYHWDLNGERFKQQVRIPRLFTTHEIYSCNAGELDLAPDTTN
jgi:hypothetical protein